MDLISLTLGVGVVGAAAFVDVRGFTWAQRRFSEKLAQEAMHRPLVREFPSSRYDISLDESE